MKWIDVHNVVPSKKNTQLYLFGDSSEDVKFQLVKTNKEQYVMSIK